MKSNTKARRTQPGSLLALLNRTGWTPVKVEAACGVSYRTVLRATKGHMPTDANVRAISMCIGATPESVRRAIERSAA